MPPLLQEQQAAEGKALEATCQQEKGEVLKQLAVELWQLLESQQSLLGEGGACLPLVKVTKDVKEVELQQRIVRTVLANLELFHYHRKQQQFQQQQGQPTEHEKTSSKVQQQQQQQRKSAAAGSTGSTRDPRSSSTSSTSRYSTRSGRGKEGKGGGGGRGQKQQPQENRDLIRKMMNILK